MTPAMPARVQLSRRKGWKMPENTVVVARPTKWGNPFKISAHAGYTRNPLGRCPLDHEGAVGFFRDMLKDPVLRAAAKYPEDLSPLRGKNLACWCPLSENGRPVPCHADVLLEIANQEEGI